MPVTLRGDGMQEARGSSPLSSTFPQVKAILCIPRMIFDCLHCAVPLRCRDRFQVRRSRHRWRPGVSPRRPSPGSRMPAGVAGRTRLLPSAVLAGDAAGAGLAALGVLAALTYLGGDLRRQLVVTGVIAGVLEPLVFLETDDHGGGSAVVGEDGFLAR